MLEDQECLSLSEVRVIGKAVYETRMWNVDVHCTLYNVYRTNSVMSCL